MFGLKKVEPYHLNICDMYRYVSLIKRRESRLIFDK
jgi:hypothetical protein